MRIRNVLKEFEAHIQSASGTGVSGKSEWKHYADGTYHIKISVRNISLPDGSTLDLMLDNLRIMQLTVNHNKARGNLESQTRTEIPDVQAGQVLQVKFGGMILGEGRYMEE